MSSAGNRNVVANVEPGATWAIWRRVAALASLLRWRVTPVETTTARRSGSKPAASSCSHQELPPSKDGGQAETDEFPCVYVDGPARSQRRR